MVHYLHILLLRYQLLHGENLCPRTLRGQYEGGKLMNLTVRSLLFAISLHWLFLAKFMSSHKFNEHCSWPLTYSYHPPPPPQDPKAALPSCYPAAFWSPPCWDAMLHQSQSCHARCEASLSCLQCLQAIKKQNSCENIDMYMYVRHLWIIYNRWTINKIYIMLNKNVSKQFPIQY